MVTWWEPSINTHSTKMKLLFISDTQSELGNLDLCQTAVDELLEYAERHKPDAIIHAGDVKEQYSPVDVPVATFWVRQTERIVKAGYRFIVMRGNHDRVSQSHQQRDWLSVLRAAGAETVAKPEVKEIGGRHVAFLPFTSDKKQEREWARELVGRSASVLVFHTDVEGAQFGGAKSGSGISVEELGAASYRFCVGGHIHNRQKIGDNIYYIGSPFAQDWNEANTKKGYVLIDGKKLKRLPTKIPGWYDLTWLVKNKVTPERGAYVRQKVVVSAKKITQQLRQAEEDILEKYKGLEIQPFIVPKLEPAKELAVNLSGSTDEERVSQYVAATFPDAARFSAVKGGAYILEKLKESGAGVAGRALRLSSVVATNCLSFSKQRVVVNYRKQGLVLLKGLNLDKSKSRSVGAGKTSILSLLPIAICGETLKGQKNDAWASERNTDKALIHLTAEDERGRKLEIYRRRRPHGLRLLVNGDDVSQGLTGKRNQETQGLIQKMFGYDLHLLRNSVYIDATQANNIVFGTQKHKMDLLAKLCDLSRFAQALKKVNGEIQKAILAQTEENIRAEGLTNEIARLRDDLRELGEDNPNPQYWRKQHKKHRLEIKRLMLAKSGLASAQLYEELQVEADNLMADAGELKQQVETKRAKEQALQMNLKRAKILIRKGRCPTCNQPSGKVGKSEAGKILAELKQVRKAAAGLETSIEGLVGKAKKHENKISKYYDELNEVSRALSDAKKLAAQAEIAAGEEAARNEKIKDKRYRIEKMLRQRKRSLRISQKKFKRLDIKIEMMQYASIAFHRSGMPLYLAASLCPALNNASEEFSELFTQGKTKIRFAVIDGEMHVQILNPSGSKTAKGQSTGESAEAGLIAAFSLREAAPKTNVLVIDEPGAGLDPVGARLFAQGLLQLKQRYETIIVTTHNPVISAILEGEKQWIVTKHRGVSKLAVN